MAAALTIFAAGASPAAATTTISSGAYGIYANLTVTPAIAAALGPIGSVSGTTALGYNNAASVVSVGQSLGLGSYSYSVLSGPLAMKISTGLIGTSATSALPTTGGSSALVNNLIVSLDVASGFGTAPLFTMTATSIGSTSVVDGTGTPIATGGSVINSLVLSGLLLNGGTIRTGANFAPTANDEFLNYFGLKIVLNEQVETSPLTTTGAGITTNALHLTISDFPVGEVGLLNGDVIIAQSGASYLDDGMAGGTVPEPAIWAQMIAGFGLVGVVTRRRRSRAVATV